MKKVIFRINSYHPEVEILEVNTDIDHIHILMIIPPNYSVSKVVNMIKANTGKRLRDKFKFLDEVYWGFKGIWSIGYFVSNYHQL